MTKDKITALKPIDAPSYGYWSALYRSFYSQPLYVDVGKRWRGLGLLYLLFMIAILCIPYAIQVGIQYNRSFQEQILDPVEYIPTVMVQKGIVSFSKPVPYLIKDSKGRDVVLIDTNKTDAEFSNKYPNLSVLINKQGIYFRIPAPQIAGIEYTSANQGSVVAQQFSEEDNMVFDGHTIIQQNATSGLLLATRIMIYPLVVVLFYSLFVVFFLVLAFLGQVFARIFFSFTPGFMQSCRLFMVAATPAMTLFVMLSVVNWVFPGSGYILLAILIAYYSFAVRALRAESKMLVQ